MAANTIPTTELKVNTEKTANESCVPVTLKQRFGKLLREIVRRTRRIPWGDAGLTSSSLSRTCHVLFDSHSPDL
jgi:hypothetical protein